jgi:hypothetical protein
MRAGHGASWTHLSAKMLEVDEGGSRTGEVR